MDPTIIKYFKSVSATQSGLGALFNELLENPLLLAFFLGPILLIGVAGAEELSRVFLLTRWMRISSTKQLVWCFQQCCLVFPTCIQGPAGVVSITLNGLIMAPAFWAHLPVDRCPLPVRCHSNWHGRRLHLAGCDPNVKLNKFDYQPIPKSIHSQTGSAKEIAMKARMIAFILVACLGLKGPV